MKYYSVIKKELNNAVCRDVHRPEDCQTEWNKSEREKQISYIKTCILFTRSVVSDSASLWKLACPSPTPRACSNSCPSSWWCHPTISSSVIPFSSCLQSFPASGSFPKSQFFASGGQRFAASASASVLPMNIQDWFPLGLTGLISLQSKGLSRVFSTSIVQKHQFFGAQLSLWSNSHIHTWLLENHTFD